MLEVETFRWNVSRSRRPGGPSLPRAPAGGQRPPLPKMQGAHLHLSRLAVDAPRQHPSPPAPLPRGEGRVSLDFACPLRGERVPRLAGAGEGSRPGFPQARGKLAGSHHGQGFSDRGLSLFRDDMAPAAAGWRRAQLCAAACYISAGHAHPQTPFCAAGAYIAFSVMCAVKQLSSKSAWRYGRYEIASRGVMTAR